MSHRHVFIRGSCRVAGELDVGANYVEVAAVGRVGAWCLPRFRKGKHPARAADQSRLATVTCRIWPRYDHQGERSVTRGGCSCGTEGFAPEFSQDVVGLAGELAGDREDGAGSRLGPGRRPTTTPFGTES